MTETPLATSLASAVAAAAIELGIREEPGQLTAEVLGLIGGPVELFETHPRWPSLLTDSGLPVELSLKIGERGEPAIRCVADVTDHRAAFADNWNRYLAYAARVVADTHVSSALLWDLCRLHLDGVPPGFRSRMIHGLGYAPSGWRRASIYFRTGWLDRERLVRRLPDEAALLTEVEQRYGTPVGGPAEVIGYDFVPDQLIRSKIYSWAPDDRHAPFDELMGRHPDLWPAREVFEAFRDDQHPTHPHGILLQTSFESGVIQQRLFFFGSAWGWSGADRFDRLLQFLRERLGIELGPLFVVTDAASGRELTVETAMVALGAEGDAPSVTFYLWPAVDTSPVPATPARAVHLSPLALADTLAKRALEYLEGRRAGDGSWRDYDGLQPGGASDAFVTAYVASTLCGAGVGHAEMAETLEWLSARYRRGLGWGWNDEVDVDSETTALALAAFARVDRPLPPKADDALVRAQLGDGSYRASASTDVDARDKSGPADVTAAVLATLVEAFPDKIGSVVPAVLSLTGGQEADGRWVSFWWDDDLVATWRAVSALSGYAQTMFARTPLGLASRRAAAGAIRDARAFLSPLAVGADPFGLALWLGSWVAVRGEDGEPRLFRVVTALAELQQPDGRWLGRPSRRLIAGDEPYVDGNCLVTTATVFAALQAVLRRATAAS